MKRLIVILIAIFSIFGVTNTNAQVGVGVSVGIAPPALPVYEQPPCPEDGYLWTPGYWAWGPDGYYWVPGVWVAPPTVGFLWTPGYWGFEGGHYWWHGGYWGSHIGFYGGVCYGYGYWGHGFYGGRWEGGHFRYNTAVCHVNGAVVRNTYIDRTVINNRTVNRTSFNGRGGVETQPTAEEKTAMNEHHVSATSAQQSHEHSAGTNRNQLASVNHGNPKTTAKSTVGGQKFNSAGHSVATNHAANATHTLNNNHTAMHSANATHANVARPQQQHNAMQNRPQPRHNAMQNRGMQRAAQPARGVQGAGGHNNGGGGGRKR